MVGLLAGKGDGGALAEANAALRRMDQLAELLGTIAFGWSITHHSHLRVLPLISAVALIGLPLEVWAIHQVNIRPCAFARSWHAFDAWPLALWQQDCFPTVVRIF